ncbi:RrF2 family transcriptional regulator [Thiohalospira sp.]|uniref:RrF2 family transcriptional regulator n=1 Tax=Thiohalospira sp. TaxID=3080549 RepID=UPI00397FAB77
MQLTRYTDYAVRVLIHLALHRDRLVTITEVAEAYAISRNHLVKVVHALGRHGFVATFRGKRGGMRLAQEPEAITLDTVVTRLEERLAPADCRDCPIQGECLFETALEEAMTAFLETLAGYSVADLVEGRGEVLRRTLEGHRAV